MSPQSILNEHNNWDWLPDDLRERVSSKFLSRTPSNLLFGARQMSRLPDEVYSPDEVRALRMFQDRIMKADSDEFERFVREDQAREDQA